MFKAHITETVVTYKNVKEVVALNQKLLLIVRSERSQHTQQLDESKEAEKATAQRQMEQIAAELGNMKERREQQQRMIQEIARQRDMYRELHNENARRTTYEQRSGDGAGGAAVDPSDSTASSSAAGAVPQSPQRGRGAQASAVAAAESALLAKTNADFAAYRAEREEADKLAIAQQSAERDAKLDAERRLAKAEAGLHFATQRVERLAAENGRLETRIAAEQAKGAKYHGEWFSAARALKDAEAELEKALAHAGVVDAKYACLEQEKTMLAKSAGRLDERNKKVEEERSRHVSIIATMRDEDKNQQLSAAQEKAQLYVRDPDALPVLHVVRVLLTVI